MIIKSLTLNNFRQFTGEQTIDFSSDPNKKVTIVMAESGVGKTTLIQSFQWILYGVCKYDKILNGDIRNDMIPGENQRVSASIVVEHEDKVYMITRKQDFHKINVRVDSDDTVLLIEYKDENGNSKQARNRDANAIIKKLMHKDLFPYFFLEGESLTKVGEQMSRGKNGSNNDFVKAIKGLLGFNWLYDAQKHLSKVSEEYNSQIAGNTSSKALKDNIEEVKSLNEDIKKWNQRIQTIIDEETYNKEQRDLLNDRITQFGEVEIKQKQSRKLYQELSDLNGKIIDQKKQVFKRFSSKGVYSLLNTFVDRAREVLKSSDSMDKGIPGINVDAVKYMLDHHKCICGEELVEGSEHWKILNDWITYLPPNNIGFELKNFSNDLDLIASEGEQFDEDFKRERKTLNDYVDSYNKKTDEYNQLTQEIEGVSVDISSLKQQEQDYIYKLTDLGIEKRQKNTNIENARTSIAQLERQQEELKKSDERTRLLQSYYAESEYLRRQISRYCDRKEKEKREKLEAAINEIFKDFYEEKITFTLDSNYGVQIKTYDKELSDDFTSGGQDVAVALAFIGAIIKLNGEKDQDPDEINDEQEKESYPLVMDAPTSNFGMKQMESFSDIMPKITDQIIVFINDKDGPILIEKMADSIGSKWSLNKTDSYHSVIAKGVK